MAWALMTGKKSEYGILIGEGIKQAYDVARKIRHFFALNTSMNRDS